MANIKAHSFTLEGQATPVSLSGVPGVAFSAAAESVTRRMWGRVYLNGTHADSMSVVSRDGTGSEEASTFFDSFTLHAPQVEPKAAPPGPG